jgi:DNA replication protein
MTEKILTIIEKGDYRIPFQLFKNYKSFELTEKDLIFLIYFINEEKTFNPKKMCSILGCTQVELLEEIDLLSSKGVLKLKLTDTQPKEEVIILDSLYKKLVTSITQFDSPSNEEEKKTIYDLFEQEFSRTLSPIEYELIGGWLEAGYSEEMISLALKEAVYNGATRLTYIDKILYEWKKKGIKNKADYEKDKMHFQNNKREIKPKKELLDYDWLNEKCE